MKKIVIVGAVALGPKVAARIKRLDPEYQVTLIDKDTMISYGGCGIPYFVGGDSERYRGAVLHTSAHVLRDSAYFKAVKGVEVFTETEATRIDRKAKVLHVRNLATGKEDTLPYDKLVLATGATPIIPPLEGIDLSGVNVVSTLHHAMCIKDKVASGQVSQCRGRRRRRHRS